MPNIPSFLDFPRVEHTGNLEKWTQAFHKVLQRQWTMMAQALNAVWKVDTAANRAASPLLDESAFYARDTGVVSLGVQGGWRTLTGFTGKVVAITSSSTIVADVGVVLADATAAEVTVTLSTIADRIFSVKKTDSTARRVYVLPMSGTIDGAASSVLGTQYHGIMIASDGTNLFQIGENI